MLPSGTRYERQCSDDRERRWSLEEMLERARHSYYPALPIALAYAGLGERDQALTWLRRAVEERNSELWLTTDPRFVSLRSDPRFLAILRLMKLA